MRDAVVFNGANNLDFQDIRANVIRIPEVIHRIREAQEIWDQVATTSLDLANFIASSNEVFLSHIKLKNFATAVVQVGLLDRYLKNHGMPKFLIGAVNGDSPLRVAAGELSFFDLINESQATMSGRSRPVVAGQNALDLPVLSGVQLAEYAAYRALPAGGFERLEIASESRDLESLILTIVETHEVLKLVMVGPGSSVSGRKIADLTARDVQVLESIDQDPMLSWFWSRLKEDRLAVAN